jgi:uncharacterized repeat protein (TIGR03803 family)
MKRLLHLLLFIPVLSFAQTYTYSTLTSFAAGGPSGPSSLIIDDSGNLYGTSSSGGKSGFGTMFKVTSKGVLTVLHSFNGKTDGSAPNSLARDIRQGNLYGTTPTTVFKMVPGKNGSYTLSTIYTNTVNQGLGAAALDSNGNLYGTGQDCTLYLPCIWEIPSSGKWTDLYDGCCVGVMNATSNLVADKTGSLYVGLGFDDIAGGGYVLQYPSGNEYGANTLPNGIDSLRQDSAGNIYGSAFGNSGGADNLGLVLKLTSTGTLSTLYNFCSLPNCADGSNPGNLTLDSKGDVFGTNTAGVFKLTSAEVESTIYTGSVGVGLVMDKSENLYGTTDQGANGLGSVYKLAKKN